MIVAVKVWFMAHEAKSVCQGCFCQSLSVYVPWSDCQEEEIDKPTSYFIGAFVAHSFVV